MRTKVELAYRLKERWENMANGILDGTGIRAVFGNCWAADDKTKTIVVAPVDERKEGAVDDALASMLHETGHMLYTDFDLFRKAAKEGKLMQHCFNAVEDVFVEYQQEARFDGARYLFEKSQTHYIKENSTEFLTAPLYFQMICSMIFQARKLPFPVVFPEVADVAKRAAKLTTCGKQTYALAQELKEIIEKKYASDGITSDMTEEEQEQAKEDAEKRLDDDMLLPPPDMWRDILKEANEDVDKSLVKAVMSRTEDVAWIDAETISYRFGDHSMPKYKPSDAAANATYRRLQDMFVAADQVVRRNNLRRGKLSSRNLYRVSTDDDRIFSKRERGVGIRDFAVSIVIDQSGSMRGREITEARRSAWAMAETFNRLHIPFAVTGFTTECGIVNIRYKGFGDSWENKREAFNNALVAMSGNCDMHSINACFKELIAYPATERLLVVISDGQPCPEPNEYLKEAVPLWMREVTVVGIGLSYDAISEFYPVHVVTDANGLAAELAAVLKRELLKR